MLDCLAKFVEKAKVGLKQVWGIVAHCWYFLPVCSQMSPGDRTESSWTLAIWTNCVRVVGFPNNHLNVQKAQMATHLLDRTAAAVLAPVCSSGKVAPHCGTWVHLRSSSPDFRRLASNFNSGDCSRFKAPTAATCSASGVSRTSPGSLSSTPSSQHSSRVVSAKTSPHCIFSFFVDSKKMGNF